MRRYIPLILMEGATVMAVELCGAKLLAPIYGGSLFVWAAILAVTLAGLAFGYYYGGVLSSRDEPEKKLFNILAFSCCFIVLMPFIASYVLEPLSFLSLEIAVVVSSVILIFFPIFFLGCTTPLLVRLNTSSLQTAGLVSGKIYAISTVGGIASTLLCGFFLIPTLGLKITLIAFAFFLFTITILVLRFLKANSTICFLLGLLISIRTVASSVEPFTLYSNHGIMGEIEVTNWHTKPYSIRQLLINKTVQTEMVISSKRSRSNYVKSIDSLVPEQDPSRHALLLGLGGGLLANLLIEKKCNVDAVEFDPRIIEAARKYFFLSPEINCFNQDARAFLNHRAVSLIGGLEYDYIILDLFKAEEQPFHVITVESFDHVKEIMKAGGTMIINWHGYLSGELGYGTKILLNTLHKAGFETTLVPGPGGEDHRNTVIVCKPVSKMDYDPSIPVNTDDQPVIELANAKANLRWRQNYLKYYQSAR